MFLKRALYTHVYGAPSGKSSSHFSSAALLSSWEMNIKSCTQLIYRSIVFSPLHPLDTKWKSIKRILVYNLNTQMLANARPWVVDTSLCISWLCACAVIRYWSEASSPCFRRLNLSSLIKRAVNSLKGSEKEMLVYDNWLLFRRSKTDFSFHRGESSCVFLLFFKSIRKCTSIKNLIFNCIKNCYRWNLMLILSMLCIFVAFQISFL